MRALLRRPLVGILSCLIFLVASCAPAAVGDGATDQPGGAQRPGPKRIVAAISATPAQIASKDVLAGSGTYPGGDTLEDLVNAGLSIIDNQSRLQPQLAEAVPSIENGLWRLLPDGRMETTWNLRPDIRWHDGVPFKADDLLFTATLIQDKALPFFSNQAMTYFEGIDAPDANTIVVKWKALYIGVDAMFSRDFAMPRPEHILGPIYAENKDGVPIHPYWGEAYVGTGPFLVRQWGRDSHLVLQANDAYILGRPKLDEIEIRFVPDANALTANLLAGEVELTLGRSLPVSQASQIRDQWAGEVGIGLKNYIKLDIQFQNPTPAALRDVQFRRALVHALDRQEMADVLESGWAPAAHFLWPPGDAVYAEVEPYIVKYGYDPRRAIQLIEESGYARGSDGMFRDGSGRSLAIDAWTYIGHEQRILVVADQLRRVGIDAQPFVMSDAQRLDRIFNNTFPGLELARQPNDPLRIGTYRSNSFPIPSRPDIQPGYTSASLDALIDRYVGTMARPERIAILGEITREMTSQVAEIPLYYNVEPLMIARRIVGVEPRRTEKVTEAWNAHQWDLR
jgi:peptide/nickel transport system substrate-binding protein